MKCKKCGSDTWVGVETSLCDNCKMQKPIPIPTKTEAQQAQTVADIKRNHRTEKGLNKLAMAHHDRGQLLKIVDSQAQKIAELQARAPKQYTEAEIRKWAKEKGMSDAFYFAYSEGAVECARFLGAIKEPHA